MARFEPTITELVVYVDDAFVRKQLEQKSLLNLRICSLCDYVHQELEDKDIFNCALADEPEYFEEGFVQAITGERIRNMDMGPLEIVFAATQKNSEDFKAYKGILVCMEAALQQDQGRNAFVMKEKKHVPELIELLYYAGNSLHVLPYDFSWFRAFDRSLVTDMIIHDCEKYKSIVMHYAELGTMDEERIYYLVTNDTALRNSDMKVMQDIIWEKTEQLFGKRLSSSEVLVGYSMEV